MDYQQTLDYLESLRPLDLRLELAPIREACHFFENPQLSYHTVHIAGTNGKGSTAAFLTSILMQSGYQVGLCTSPHLIDVRERIQIDRIPITKEEFAYHAGRIRDSLLDERGLTYFEFLTLLAFLYFQEKKVDFAVVETGLGGRLDATNVIIPQVVVITPISLDHQRHLGRTLTEIANEKCGVIKRAISTVVALQPPEVMDVVRRWCDEMGSPLCLASPEEITQPLGLAGEHQRQNAACAVEAAHLLSDAKFTIEHIDSALLQTRWDGRMETVRQSPRVILDGAHNPAGAQALAAYIESQSKRETTVLMLGVMADKDLHGICRPLAPLVREVVCVRAPTERAASPKDIAARVRSFGAQVHQEDEIGEALTKWLPKLQKTDTLVISGSLTTVGAAKKYFQTEKE
jgi:dihydrofolate synthase/folylpolyglutamate synthase